ncbi:MAG: zinc carboxypeptidase, partial [Bacteroidota bacterium]
IHTLVSKASTSTGIRFVPAATGFTPQGVDLGSPSFSMLKKPEVLLLVGNGVTSYDAGEVWHLLDQRYDMAITMMESDEFDNNAINRYNTIVLVNGFYNDIGDLNRLKSWIRQGGTLIVMRNAVSWAKSKGLANVNYKRAKKKNKTKKSRPYNQLSADRGAQFIGGAIFETQLDLTHPLCYGYQQNRLPVFRRGTLFLEKGNTPYSTPVRYTANPLLSGYIADANLQLLKSSATVIVTGMGSGKVIAMTDNPNFRAFWYGTNRLFANAIFFGHTINGRSTESAPPPMKDKKE